MKIEKIALIPICIIFGMYAGNLFAQEVPVVDSTQVQEVKEELFKEVSIEGRREPYKPQWQKDFDAMRLKSNEEMARSLKLSIEQKKLELAIEKLTSEYVASQSRKQDLQIKISAQQELLDEKKWKASVGRKEGAFKNAQVQRDNELAQCRKDIQLLQDKIDVTRLKLKMMGIEDLSDARLALQQERNILEAKIIGNEEKLRDLSAKILAIKSRGMKLDPRVEQVKKEIESSRTDLRQMEEQQKELKGTSGVSLEDTIEILRRQKIDVQKSTDEVKGKVLKYRKSQKMGIENNRIKKLIESISAVDAANSALNDEISNLTENITILKVRIKRLEYKNEAMKALKGTSQPMAR
ncbi:MAG: hypothetical protein JNN05_03690 [Candidatus Omnitrophica bacterium]|nr:hypothetical protein [Candidatus Omnitrophota bacterium]